MDNLAKEMGLLLNNFWITKEEHPEEYYLLKRKQGELRKFIFKNLGSKLIVHDRFIKLEKISNVPSRDQGIEEFVTPMDYTFLFLFLLYLEDKPRGEKFILSELIEYVKNTAITFELTNIPDWTYSSHRKSLIRVINYLLKRHVITLKDEDKISFQDNQNADALYEVTGISNYLIPSFDYEIYHLEKPEEFLNNQWGEQDVDHGDIRRYNVYRNLLYLPAVHRDNLTDSEYDYLKKMHKTIEKELQDFLDLSVEITQNMAFIYMDESTIQKDYFPNTKRLSDIILLINSALMNYILSHKVKPKDDETFTVSCQVLKDIILQIRIDKKEYFSKAYLELNTNKYLNEILMAMKNYHFIKEDIESQTYTVYPLIYRFLGEPRKKEEINIKQMDLFGGDINEL